jgi:hypothetical protein
MAGGWASALGAAILGGGQRYTELSQIERQKKQDDLVNQARILQNAILQRQLQLQPQNEAAAKAEDIYKLSPEAAFNNPEFIKQRAAAGRPVNVMPDAQTAIQKNRVDAVETGEATIPTTDQAATSLGVAPQTGAVVPPEISFAQRKREKEMQQLDTQMQMLKGLSGSLNINGSAQPNAAPGAVATAGSPALPGGAPNPGPIYDQGDVNKRLALKLGLGVDPASVLGPVQKTPAQIAQEQHATVDAKRKFAPLSSDAQKAVDAMLEWGPHYRGVIDKLQSNNMFDPSKPDVGNGILDTIKNTGRRVEYNFHNPPEPYKSLIQETEMANANMLGPMLHGIRNPQMIDMLKAHFPSTYASPASMGDRTSAIVAAIPQRIADVYRAEGKEVPPEVMERARQFSAGLKVSPDLIKALGSADSQGLLPNEHAQITAPGVVPQQGAAAAPKTVPYAKAVAVASANGLDPNKYIAQLKAEGVAVTK